MQFIEDQEGILALDDQQFNVVVDYVGDEFVSFLQQKERVSMMLQGGILYHTGIVPEEIGRVVGWYPFR